MSSFCSVTIVGNLTRDPELKYLQSGTAVCDLGIAVNERRKQADGSYSEIAHFFDVTCWARTAEVANEFCVRGSRVLVNGRLVQETWEKDGQKRSKVKIVCEQLVLLGSKPQGERRTPEGNQERPATDDVNQDGPQAGGDDTPF